MDNYKLSWTEKVELSSRIIDPLGIYVLKDLEQSYLPGITTQTARLRYYSLMTWVWKVIEELNLSPRKVLDIEKIVTLVAASHHIDTPNYPLGIRSRGPATDYLRKHNLLKFSEFTKFGRDNTVGYGNLYYRGPLSTMHICSKYGNSYRFSNVGEKVVEITENAFKGIKEILPSASLSTKKLNELVGSCLCESQILQEEKEIWRHIFFGFTKSSSGFSLDLDLDEFDHFNKGKIAIQKIEPDAPPDLETYLKSLGRSEITVLDSMDNNMEFMKKSLQRRYVLFLIMKIVDECNPKVNSINQDVRDCIYFSQYDNNGSPQTLDFGRLEDFRKLWEVYVHNLYYINFLENVFNLLLDNLKAFPNGTSIDEITSLWDFGEVEQHLSNIGFENLKKYSIKEIESKLAIKLHNKKTSLRKSLNEREVALRLDASNSREEKAANLLVLLLLLKQRFNMFTEEQKKICSFQDKWWNSILPEKTYLSLPKGTIKDFLKKSFELVKNRHKFISAKKFDLNGTKAWLITEEDGRLYFYGSNYNRVFYRESKWSNVLQLLADMELIKINDTCSLTKLGKNWLAKIS